VTAVQRYIIFKANNQQLTTVVFICTPIFI